MKAFLLSTSCLLAIVSLAGTASAQSAAPSQAMVGEVVVTAQRRSESLQRAAIPVSAVSANTLLNAGVSEPKQLTSLVPSLQVASSAGPYSIFYLRGVGNFNGNALSDAAVSFNVDGVYIARPSSTNGFFYDLNRVEVVNGPQGTLYGRNATGGAINVITHAPDLGKFESDASLEFGNYDAIRADGDINIPIDDNAAFRASGVYVKHSGYLSDGADDQNDFGTRLEFKAEPSDTLKVVASADYFNQGGRGAGATVPELGLSNRIGLNDPRAAAFYESQLIPVAQNFFGSPAISPYERNTYWGVSATIDWQTPVGQVTVIPAYREGHLNFNTNAPGFQLAQQESDKQTSLELRLASSDAHKLRYLIGGYFFDEANDVPTFFVNQEYSLTAQSYQARTQSQAVFGRLTYAFTDNFRLTGGVRYTSDNKQFNGTLGGATELCIHATCPGATPFAYSLTTLPTGAGPTGTILLHDGFADADKKQFGQVTYRAAADWDLTSRNLLYASYETGFKSGGFFLSADNNTYRPETIDAYTLGSKNRFFDNTVTLNGELFYWQYKNQQISHLSQDSHGDLIFPTENVGAATFKGVEVQAQYTPFSNTLLGADVQFLDANYDNFAFTLPVLGGTPVTGCAVSAPAKSVYPVNCSGRRPPNAPEWTVNLTAQQTFPLSNDGNITLAARAHYQSDTLTGLDFLPDEVQGAYITGDLQATYTAPRNRYYLTVFVNNVSNATILAETFDVPLATFQSAELRDPRTYGVRIGAHF